MSCRPTAATHPRTTAGAPAGPRRGKRHMDNVQKCPFSSKSRVGRTNQEWWPDRLNLSALHTNHPAGDPMDEGFDYASEFLSLDLAAVKKDIEAVMTDSQPWWPA